MKKISFDAILFLIVLLIGSNLISQETGYKIDIKVNGLSEATLILGHYFSFMLVLPSKMSPTALASSSLFLPLPTFVFP